MKLAPTGGFSFFRFLAISTGVMAALLAFVLFVLWASNDFDGLGISAAGLIGWILGSIVTAAVGMILMGLVFLSDRTGRDAEVHEAIRITEHSLDDEISNGK